MHTSCMKNLHFKNKRFLFYISTPWTVSEKPLYSKAMCLLWVMNFLGFHRRRRTPFDTFADFHRWMHSLTKNTCLLPEGVSIPSYYYSTHKIFKPFDSRTPSLFQSPPFKHPTHCSFMPCTQTRFTQCPCAYAMQNAISCSFMLHA